jgi:hypothetical protein
MGTRYRFSLEIADIRERIDNLRGTEIYWREMSLAAKVRTLVLERIEEVENQNKAAANLAELDPTLPDSPSPNP